MLYDDSLSCIKNQMFDAYMVGLTQFIPFKSRSIMSLWHAAVTVWPSESSSWWVVSSASKSNSHCFHMRFLDPQLFQVQQIFFTHSAHTHYFRIVCLIQKLSIVMIFLINFHPFQCKDPDMMQSVPVSASFLIHEEHFMHTPSFSLILLSYCVNGILGSV